MSPTLDGMKFDYLLVFQNVIKSMPDKLEKILYKTQDEHGVIQVTEHNLVRTLYFGKDKKQSSMFMPEPSVLVLSYAQAMAAALMFVNEPKRILIVGLGGGSLVQFLLKFYPECEIHVVELRESVINVAQEYFLLPENSGRLTIIHEDAVSYVKSLMNRQNESYDIILIDAFDQWGPAEINQDMEFILNCQSLLSKNGVLSFNLWNRKEDEYPLTYRSLLSLFNGNLLELSLGKRDSNVILFGFNDEYHIKNIRVAEMRSARLKMDLGIDFPRYVKLLQVQNFSILKKIKKHFTLSF